MRKHYKFFPGLLLTAFFVFVQFGSLLAQNDRNPDPNVTKFPLEHIPLAGKVNLSKVQPDYGAFMANTNVIHTPGIDRSKDEFLKWKEEANRQAEIARQTTSALSNKTQSLNPPTVGTNFFGNPADEVPNDNSIAISAGGKIVTTMNTLVRVYNETGGSPLLTATFSTFTAQVGLGNAIKFDPKVVYDPIADRFILVFLYGDQPSNSKSIICFSETNDPSGSWNIYTIAGNLNAAGVWADFPQIGISTEELFLTCNLFAGSSFQNTGLWQIKLADGYAGDPLTTQSYSSNYFSMHPVMGAYTMYGPHFYLLSHQSANSSAVIYVHKISGNLASNPVLNSPVTMNSNVAYSIPPSADQRSTNTMLQTNDCRVQSSYFENNRIQFAMNTAVAGKPGIYYGTLFISPLGLGFSQLTATYISDPVLELAYPAVAYAGSQALSGDNASFVMFNFCSPDHYPSNGAVYLDGSGLISPVGTLKGGSGSTGFGSQWRWGDYADICERAGTNGEAWVGGSYGSGSGGTATWVTQITVPPPVAITPPVLETGGELSVYPNPTTDQVIFDFPVNNEGRYSVVIMDETGKQVAEILERGLKAGDARLVFHTEPLSPGIYFVSVINGDKPVFTEKFVKTK